ncbi:MAG: PEP-CTERM sorting domain-containing protein [Methylophilaceae bacterium]
MKPSKGILSTIFTVALVLSVPLSAQANQTYENNHHISYNARNAHIEDMLVTKDIKKNLSKDIEFDEDSFLANSEKKHDSYAYENKNTGLSWSARKHDKHDSHTIFDIERETKHKLGFEDYFKDKEINHHLFEDNDEHGLFGDDGDHDLFGEHGDRCHVQPVPEPESYLLMLVGFVLMMVIGRQRKLY